MAQDAIPDARTPVWTFAACTRQNRRGSTERAAPGSGRRTRESPERGREAALAREPAARCDLSHGQVAPREQFLGALEIAPGYERAQGLLLKLVEK